MHNIKRYHNSGLIWTSHIVKLNTIFWRKWFTDQSCTYFDGIEKKRSKEYNNKKNYE